MAERDKDKQRSHGLTRRSRPSSKLVYHTQVSKEQSLKDLDHFII